MHFQFYYLQFAVFKTSLPSEMQYDLATFSLVLEYIENLNDIFLKLAEVIIPGGYVYIGELLPFKQYADSKARFCNEEGEQVVNCYTQYIRLYNSSITKQI